MSGASFQALMAAAGVSGTTLDSVGGECTLSNGNLTVTRSSFSVVNDTGARSTLTKTTGKYYFEFTRGQSNGASNSVGLILSTGTYGDLSGGNKGSIWFVNFGPGYIYSNNASSTLNTATSSVATDVIGCAVDLTARLVWFRKNNGVWNANGANNPATGVGGITVLASGAFAPVVCFSSGGAGNVNDTVTANFGATAFAQTAPSGFGNWA